MNPKIFFGELKRRNVYKVAVTYVVAGWALAQGIAQVFPIFDVPSWVVRLLVLLIVIGFPIALILAWVFELTPGGLKRTAAADAAEQHSAGHVWIYVVIVGVLLSTTLFMLARYGVREKNLLSNELPAKSIAVLPFVNMSSDKEQDYFSDGLSEELLNLLAQVPQLRVIARTSSFSFKGKEVDVSTIAKALNVANVLEGSVRKSGDTVRITAQLIRASDSSHLWSQAYDRQMTDVFKVQDEIAAAVVEQLKVRLLGAAPKRPVTDPDTYTLFLQGREVARQYNREAFEQAIAIYKQALTIDPSYAPAWSGLA